MAQNTFDVTAAVVLKHLAQFSVTNVTLPGTNDITDEWIPLAAGEIEDAGQEGGFDFSEVDSTNEPDAYYILRHLLALRAALHYLAAAGHAVGEGLLKARWDKTEKKLDDIRSGRRVAQMTVTDGAQGLVFYHGTDSDDDLDDYRAQYDDPL